MTAKTDMNQRVTALIAFWAGREAALAIRREVDPSQRLVAVLVVSLLGMPIVVEVGGRSAGLAFVTGLRST